jgi:hypothetical protein
MFSLIAFGFFKERVTGFALSGRYYRGHGYTTFKSAFLPTLDENFKRNNDWRREGTRTISVSNVRLRAAPAVITLDKQRKDDKTGEQIPKKNTPGTIDGFSITKMYKTDLDSGFDMDQIKSLVDSDDIRRLELTPRNISVPVALMMLDPVEYPTKSRARKACRKANIMIHRGPLQNDEESGEVIFDAEKCIRARVGFRIFPGDVLCKQVRIGDGKVPAMRHKKPPFELPVIFEDDHFAIGKQKCVQMSLLTLLLDLSSFDAHLSDCSTTVLKSISRPEL